MGVFSFREAAGRASQAAADSEREPGVALPDPMAGGLMGRQAVEPEHRFGASPSLTIGVEEELLLVDDERRLVAAAERVIEGLDPAARQAVSTEIFAAQIELK